MVSAQVQSEIQDGVRCAICEELFGVDPRPRMYLHEQGVMVHVDEWSI